MASAGSRFEDKQSSARFERRRSHGSPSLARPLDALRLNASADRAIQAGALWLRSESLGLLNQCWSIGVGAQSFGRANPQSRRACCPRARNAHFVEQGPGWASVSIMLQPAERVLAGVEIDP
jgi:hypothetical protein